MDEPTTLAKKSAKAARDRIARRIAKAENQIERMEHEIHDAEQAQEKAELELQANGPKPDVAKHPGGRPASAAWFKAWCKDVGMVDSKGQPNGTAKRVWAEFTAAFDLTETPSEASDAIQNVFFRWNILNARRDRLDRRRARFAKSGS